jgi:serine/threonine protein kinase
VDLGIEGFTDVEFLGRGGFGTVYRVNDDAHGRHLAVKILPATLDESGRRQFDRERRAMGLLSGVPNIGVVHTSGFTASGEPYIVMELLSGGSLADRIAKGPIPVAQVVNVGAAMAEALHHAHAEGVLHLDLKPENILFDERGVPKLVDFGIAKLADDERFTATIRATPAYAAPEVLEGNPATHAADIYSLAVTLYTSLMGVAPFAGDSMLTVLRRIAVEPVPVVDRADVPIALRELLRRAMDKEPGGRPATMADFARELRAIDPDDIPDARPAADATQDLSAFLSPPPGTPSGQVSPSGELHGGAPVPPPFPPTPTGGGTPSGVSGISGVQGFAGLPAPGGGTPSSEFPGPPPGSSGNFPGTPSGQVSGNVGVIGNVSGNVGTAPPVAGGSGRSGRGKVLALVGVVAVVAAVAIGFVLTRSGDDGGGTRAAAAASVASVAFSPGVDADGRPEGGTGFIPEGSTELCLSWTYEGFTPGTAWSVTWEVDRRPQASLSASGALGGSSGPLFACITNPSGVLPGLYEATWAVGGSPVLSDAVYVGPQRPPVTISITNGLGAPLCQVNISPSDARTWGTDLVDQLASGAAVTHRVAAGRYDLRALDCNGGVIWQVLAEPIGQDTSFTAGP